MNGHDTAPAVTNRGGAQRLESLFSNAIVRPTTRTGVWLDDYLDQFVRRIIIDALQEATAAYWEGRARQLEAACWRPGDYTGNATADDLAARDQRLREAARACRARAHVHTIGGVW